MTAREVLVAACAKNKKAPYTPLAFITTAVTVKMMEKSGVYWPQAHMNPEQMATLGAMGYELYRIPCLKIPFDTSIEAGILGARVDLGKLDTFPQVHCSTTVIDAEKLIIPDDLAGAGRIPIVLEAVKILRKRYPEVPVVAHAMGPFSIMSLLFGFEKILEWIMLDDVNYPMAMEKCTEVSKRFSALLEDAGADIIQFGEAAASSEVIGPDMYATHVAPYHMQLANRLKAPCVLHICGDISKSLPSLSSTGIDAISYDYKVNNIFAKHSLGGQVKTVGNIDPLGVLLNGTPDDVYCAVNVAMDENVDVLAPGCCLPLRMPEENLIALAESHREYLKSKGIFMS